MMLKSITRKVGTVAVLLVGFTVGANAQITITLPSQLEDRTGRISYKSTQTLQQEENERAAREFRQSIVASRAPYLDVSVYDVPNLCAFSEPLTLVIVKDEVAIHRTKLVYDSTGLIGSARSRCVATWSNSVAQLPFEGVVIDESRNSKHILRFTVNGYGERGITFTHSELLERYAERAAEERQREAEERQREAKERRTRRTYEVRSTDERGRPSPTVLGTATLEVASGTLTVNGWTGDYSAYPTGTVPPWAYDGIRITNLVVESNNNAIGNQAFKLHSNLRTITISGSTPSIGTHAFFGCTNITSITIGADTPPVANNNSFPRTVLRNACLYVPANSIDAYRSARVWRKFQCIRPIEN